MCAIGGIYLKTGEQFELGESLQKILNIQRHRGPNVEGMWLTEDRRLGLCHNRLTVLDLTVLGSQPMHSADGQFVAVFNGEIYNYKNICKALERVGVIFRSHTGTEVLIEAYRHWGEDMLCRLRSMFALSSHILYYATIILCPPPHYRVS